MGTSLRSAWPQVVGQAWADPEFRQRLIDDPKGALQEIGVDVSATADIEIVVDTPEVTHLVLPEKPSELGSFAGSMILAGDYKPTPGQCTEGHCDAGLCTEGHCDPGGGLCTEGHCHPGGGLCTEGHCDPGGGLCTEGHCDPGGGLCTEGHCHEFCGDGLCTEGSCTDALSPGLCTEGTGD